MSNKLKATVVPKKKKVNVVHSIKILHRKVFPIRK